MVLFRKINGTVSDKPSSIFVGTVSDTEISGGRKPKQPERLLKAFSVGYQLRMQFFEQCRISVVNALVLFRQNARHAIARAWVPRSRPRAAMNARCVRSHLESKMHNRAGPKVTAESVTIKHHLAL